MKLRWSPTAERNADLIWDYIAQDNIDAADSVRQTIHSAAERLCDYPRMGRSGRAAKTRELAVAGTPYIIIYRIFRSEIEIVRVMHGAQDWPPKG
jgi:toxin ParE1/3/4